MKVWHMTNASRHWLPYIKYCLIGVMILVLTFAAMISLPLFNQTTPKRDTTPDIIRTHHHTVQISSPENGTNIKKSKVPTVDRRFIGNYLYKRNPKVKTILLWNKFFHDATFGMFSTGTKPFKRCRVKTCATTNDISALSYADAVVIHMRNMFYPFPVRQNDRQLFVFYLFESPQNSFYSEKTRLHPDIINVFNVTITYRYDSDIPMPMLTDITPKKNPLEYRIRIPFKNKTRNIVWLASHCHTPGRRERYLEALGKYIDVEIYGQCGHSTCERWKRKRCENMFDSRYRFFFAAENSICEQYASEKLIKGLDHEMVPLVYGGYNYSWMLPPHSYIDITHYKSPKHLAEYLHYLAANEKEYYKYFDWKWKYRKRGVTKEMAMCKLCELAHDPTYHKTYSDVQTWWMLNNGKDRCSTSFMDKMIADGLA